MARKSEPHPETDQTGETIEFAPIKLEQERICHELRDDEALALPQEFQTPVEIRIGQTTETSPFFLKAGEDFRELCEAEGVDPDEVRYARVLVQPDVMAKNPEMGWAVIGPCINFNIGRADTPQFRLGGDIARRGHLWMLMQPVETKELPDEQTGELLIVSGSKNPTKVLVSSEHRINEVRLRWVDPSGSR
jgi:hypothetical protein